MDDEAYVTLKFIYPEGTASDYLLSRAEAMELEILAITKPPKRLMRTIHRVGRDLLDRAIQNKVSLDLILGTSRSGDIYNALKFLEYKKVIERRKDTKIITIVSRDELNKILNRIEDLLKT